MQKMKTRTVVKILDRVLRRAFHSPEVDLSHYFRIDDASTLASTVRKVADNQTEHGLLLQYQKLLTTLYQKRFFGVDFLRTRQNVVRHYGKPYLLALKDEGLLQGKIHCYNLLCYNLL